MKAQLVTEDGSTIAAIVEVPDFPDNPEIVKYKNQYFMAQFGYGNAPLSYAEKIFLDVSTQ